MSFNDAVRELIERCPGAQGAAIVDRDGIAVTVFPAGNGIDVLGAELATIIRGVDDAGREFKHGPLEQFSVFTEKAVVILTTMASGYFLLLIMNRDGVVGKARFLSRLTREQLRSEFI